MLLKKKTASERSSHWETEGEIGGKGEKKDTLWSRGLNQANG